MKTVLFLLVVLLAGCSSGRRPVVHVTPHEYTAPSAEPVAAGVRGLHADVRAVRASNVKLATELGTALEAARQARDSAGRIERQGVAANSGEARLLSAKLGELQTSLLRANAENVTLRETAARAEERATATEKSVQDLQGQVAVQTRQLNGVEAARVVAVNKLADETEAHRADREKAAQTIAARDKTIVKLIVTLIGVVLLVAGFFVARQYLPFLKLI